MPSRLYQKLSKQLGKNSTNFVDKKIDIVDLIHKELNRTGKTIASLADESGIEVERMQVIAYSISDIKLSEIIKIETTLNIELIKVSKP